MALKLNLGCGKDIRKGWVNIDRFPGEGVDMVLDLEASKLPFPDDSVEEVLASHILEHLLRWEDLLLEIRRVLRPGGKLTIRVPYGLLPYIYHVRFFLPWTIDGFCADTLCEGVTSLEAKPLFRKLEQRVHRRLPFRWHLKHYLGIEVRERWPIGRKFEIVWILEKVSS